MGDSTTMDQAAQVEIPQECIAGVVKNEGPDFEIEVKKVPVPEVGELQFNHLKTLAYCGLQH